MKNFPALLTLLLTGIFSVADAQATFSSEKLLDDYAIVEKAFQSLHPALYKYGDTMAVQRNFDRLKEGLSRDLTLSETYLAFSRFTAGIRCGHTFCNFWNQGKRVKKELFAASDKVPFTFKLIGRQMVVDKNLSGNEKLVRGVEVLSINGNTVDAVVDSLLTVVSADGSNDGMRMHAMQLEGTGDYEWFDVYFPLFFPPEAGKYRLEVRNLSSGEEYEMDVTAISRRDRFSKMQEQYGPLPETYDDLWEFRILNDKTAYLKLGTFVTYKMNLKWKKFIREAFDEIAEKKIPNLVLDIRGNAGGMDDVSRLLGDYLITSRVELPRSNTILRYETVPEDLRPYLSTWDKSFYDFRGKLKPDGIGNYTLKKGNDDLVIIKPGRKAYSGEVWLLIDGANSSATFTLARMIKQNGLGTLVGQPTGGNLNGINGGGIFFLTLPNSGIEMDIPIYGNYPVSPQPDRGVEPDILAAPTVNDVINGVDTAMELVMRQIEKGESDK